MISLPRASIFVFEKCSNIYSSPRCKVKSLQQCIFVLTFVSSVLSNMFFKVQAWGPWFTSCWKHSSWDLHVTPKRHSYIPSHHLYCWISLSENLNTQFQICIFFCWGFVVCFFLNINFHPELENTYTLWLPLTLTKQRSVWS